MKTVRKRRDKYFNIFILIILKMLDSLSSSIYDNKERQSKEDTNWHQND